MGGFECFRPCLIAAVGRSKQVDSEEIKFRRKELLGEVNRTEE